jgi:formyltetrahydrofolate synthetase
VITESGFAADLGMEKFMDIVCRVGGLRPHVVVIVATVRALRHHGQGDWREKAALELMAAEVESGMANLAKHIENVRAFGIQPVVAINTRPDDEPELLELIKTRSVEAGAFGAAIHNGFGQGGEGTTELAEVVAAAAEAESDFHMLYADDELIATKIEKIATTVYGADGIELAPAARDAIARYEKQGLAHLPICMAKTHLSLSHDPLLRNRTDGFTVPIRDIRVYSGAGMLVALCGDMLQMPGLGSQPAAFAIDIDENGETVGLF